MFVFLASTNFACPSYTPQWSQLDASVPQAASMEDAIRLLQERGQKRAEGSRQVSLFSEKPTA